MCSTRELGALWLPNSEFTAAQHWKETELNGLVTDSKQDREHSEFPWEQQKWSSGERTSRCAVVQNGLQRCYRAGGLKQKLNVWCFSHSWKLLDPRIQPKPRFRWSINSKTVGTLVFLFTLWGKLLPGENGYDFLHIQWGTVHLLRKVQFLNSRRFTQLENQKFFLSSSSDHFLLLSSQPLSLGSYEPIRLICVHTRKYIEKLSFYFPFLLKGSTL